VLRPCQSLLTNFWKTCFDDTGLSVPKQLVTSLWMVVRVGYGKTNSTSWSTLSFSRLCQMAFKAMFALTLLAPMLCLQLNLEKARHMHENAGRAFPGTIRVEVPNGKSRMERWEWRLIGTRLSECGTMNSNGARPNQWQQSYEDQSSWSLDLFLLLWASASGMY